MEVLFVARKSKKTSSYYYGFLNFCEKIQIVLQKYDTIYRIICNTVNKSQSLKSQQQVPDFLVFGERFW